MYKKRTFLLGALIVLLSMVNVSADTIIPGGNVSGTWTAAGSPYQVQGNITVPLDDTLLIEPGVEVIFYGLYTLNVDGSLQANGTETDSIISYRRIQTRAGIV